MLRAKNRNTENVAVSALLNPPAVGVLKVENAAEKSEKRAALALQLKDGLLRLGPTFIKLGQLLSTRWVCRYRIPIGTNNSTVERFYRMRPKTGRSRCRKENATLYLFSPLSYLVKQAPCWGTLRQCGIFSNNYQDRRGTEGVHQGAGNAAGQRARVSLRIRQEDHRGGPWKAAGGGVRQLQRSAPCCSIARSGMHACAYSAAVRVVLRAQVFVAGAGGSCCLPVAVFVVVVCAFNSCAFLLQNSVHALTLLLSCSSHCGWWLFSPNTVVGADTHQALICWIPCIFVFFFLSSSSDRCT